ncbi:unnamed protein product [Cuscuta epithymum]|uniref:Uncharacterized protein n=1 Tax=Cuscuta epithymum TaxID=186058 RepID=A0AAV0D722_9ASTE|nr:unnamed protein product [Cuscuta epithymum]
MVQSLFFMSTNVSVRGHECSPHFLMISPFAVSNTSSMEDMRLGTMVTRCLKLPYFLHANFLNLCLYCGCILSFRAIPGFFSSLQFIVFLCICTLSCNFIVLISFFNSKIEVSFLIDSCMRCGLIRDSDGLCSGQRFCPLMLSLHSRMSG